MRAGQLITLVLCFGMLTLTPSGIYQLRAGGPLVFATKPIVWDTQTPISFSIDKGKLGPLTGDESVVAEVKNVQWPKLLDPVDDVPPATVITAVRRSGDKLTVTGITHDNGKIVSVSVNGKSAQVASNRSGVADWSIELPMPSDGKLTAESADDAGNKEITSHATRVELYR